MEFDFTKYQKENFGLKVEKDRYEAGMVQISTTHNGSAWSSLRVYETELPQIIEALQNFSGLTPRAVDWAFCPRCHEALIAKNYCVHCECDVTPNH